MQGGTFLFFFSEPTGAESPQTRNGIYPTSAQINDILVASCKMWAELLSKPKLSMDILGITLDLLRWSGLQLYIRNVNSQLNALIITRF